MKKQMTVRKTVLAALFLAIGLILPFITMQIPAVGKMLCPMHIPVLLCGYILGGPYGLIVGFITPLLRSVTFGMPVMLPNAIDRKSTRLNSSHDRQSRMPSSA